MKRYNINELKNMRNGNMKRLIREADDRITKQVAAFDQLDKYDLVSLGTHIASEYDEVPELWFKSMDMLDDILKAYNVDYGKAIKMAVSGDFHIEDSLFVYNTEKRTLKSYNYDSAAKMVYDRAEQLVKLIVNDGSELNDELFAINSSSVKY